MSKNSFVDATHLQIDFEKANHIIRREAWRAEMHRRKKLQQKYPATRWNKFWQNTALYAYKGGFIGAIMKGRRDKDLERLAGITLLFTVKGTRYLSASDIAFLKEVKAI